MNKNQVFLCQNKTEVVKLRGLDFFFFTYFILNYSSCFHIIFFLNYHLLLCGWTFNFFLQVCFILLDFFKLFYLLLNTEMVKNTKSLESLPTGEWAKTIL